MACRALGGVDRALVWVHRARHRRAQSRRGESRACRSALRGTALRGVRRSVQAGARRGRGDRLAGARRGGLAGEAWALAELGSSRGARASGDGEELVEGPQFATSTGPTCSSASVSAATSSLSVSSAVRSSTRRSRSPSVQSSPAISCEPTSSGWRSRCRRHQRDFEAAREDVEAHSSSRRRWTTGARSPTSTTRRRSSPSAPVIGLPPQLRGAGEGALPGAQRRAHGRSPDAEPGWAALAPRQARPGDEHLKAAFASAVESESKPDAAQALGNLATVYLHLGDYDAADEHARRGLELLEERVDYLHEIGQSNVVLGCALMERGRLVEAEECFRAGDSAFESWVGQLQGGGLGRAR